MTFASYYDLSKLNLFILDDNKFMRKVLETMCERRKDHLIKKG